MGDPFNIPIALRRVIGASSDQLWTKEDWFYGKRLLRDN